jgi:hypothetical protein
MEYGSAITVWAAISRYGILFISLIHFMAELLKVERLCNQVHRWSRRYFLNNDTVFEDNAPYTQLELFSHGLKNMSVNFNTLS